MSDEQPIPGTPMEDAPMGTPVIAYSDEATGRYIRLMSSFKSLTELHTWLADQVKLNNNGEPADNEVMGLIVRGLVVDLLVIDDTVTRDEAWDLMSKAGAFSARISALDERETLVIQYQPEDPEQAGVLLTIPLFEQEMPDVAPNASR